MVFLCIIMTSLSRPLIIERSLRVREAWRSTPSSARGVAFYTTLQDAVVEHSTTVELYVRFSRTYLSQFTRRLIFVRKFNFCNGVSRS